MEHDIWEKLPGIRTQLDDAHDRKGQKIAIPDYMVEESLKVIREVRESLLAERAANPHLLSEAAYRTMGSHEKDARFGHFHFGKDMVEGTLVPTVHWDRIDVTEFPLGHFAESGWEFIKGLFGKD